MSEKFIENVVSAIKEVNPGEMMTISKRVYQLRIGKSYRAGQVDALLSLGKTNREISEILDLQESTVRSIIERSKK